MTKRLEVLKASLVKKEAELDRRMQAHFDTVKEANGQPLNDKRNGQATLNKWEKQNDAIRNQQAEIEKTKRAIEFEEGKIAHVGSVSVPSFITDLIDAGEISGSCRGSGSAACRERRAPWRFSGRMAAPWAWAN